MHRGLNYSVPPLRSLCLCGELLFTRHSISNYLKPVILNLRQDGIVADAQSFRGAGFVAVVEAQRLDDFPALDKARGAGCDFHQRACHV